MKNDLNAVTNTEEEGNGRFPENAENTRVESPRVGFANPFHFGKSGFSAYFSRQIRISGFYPDFFGAGPYRPIYTV